MVPFLIKAYKKLMKPFWDKEAEKESKKENDEEMKASEQEANANLEIELLELPGLEYKDAI